MTALAWDQTGERGFETGVDRGVLGLRDGTVVAWNGIIGVEDSPSSDLKSFYLDGVKILDNLTPGDFVGKLKAYMYPDEFNEMDGKITIGDPGILFHEQPRKKFNLSYRTKKGNDVDQEAGYKIHFLYNLVADPDTKSYQTETDTNVDPIEFSWTLSGTPVKIDQIRPPIHVEIDSTTCPPEVLSAIEELLYGTDLVDPVFPDMDTLAAFFGYVGSLIITDHGDGTWSATGADGVYITMISATEFQIDNVDATYLDAETFTVTSTYAGWS